MIGRIFSKEAGEKIMNSNFAAKIKEKEYYESARQLGKSSVYASACVYDGATEALSMIGKIKIFWRYENLIK